MAWIKLDKDMLDDGRLLNWLAKLQSDDDPQTVRDVSAPRPTRNELTGAIVRLWVHADTHISDDDTLELTPDGLDFLVDMPGFFNQSPRDWIDTTDDGRVRLPGYCEKNGVVNKRLRREKDAERKRASRRPAGVRNTSARTPGGHGASDLDLDQDQDPKDKKKPDYDSVANLDPGAWAAWLAYRRAEKMRAYRSTQVATKLSKFPAAEQRAAVEESITAGWQGLFPKNDRSKTSGRGRTFEDSTRRLGEWYLEQTGHVLPVDG